MVRPVALPGVGPKKSAAGNMEKMKDEARKANVKIMDAFLVHVEMLDEGFALTPSLNLV